MRRNIYIRLLFSIVGITILVLVMQTIMLVFATRVAEKSWKSNVFDNYVKTLSLNFQDNHSMTFADMIYSLVDSAPDRVSGLLIRDESGDISISIGSSGRGDFIPQPIGGGPLIDNYRQSSLAIPKSFSVSVNTTEDYIVQNVNLPEYRIDIESRNVGGNLIVESIAVRESGEEGKVQVRIPSVIESNDIAGSLMIYNNGRIYGYIDILVFDIDVYDPTKMLLRDMAGKFVIFLPIAIIISLISGYLISKRNIRMIKEIRGSLRQLANGHYSVKVDKNLVKYDDFDVIADSIEQLGKDLDRHRLSRKEWLKNISHDLNTPLTSMNILLSAAEDGLYPLNVDLIKSLKKEADTLISRIASVNFYSNLLNYKSERVQNFSLFEVVASSLEGRSGYKVEGDMDRLVINGDFDLVKRAFKEVLDNAETYGKKGEEIIIAVREEKDFAIISIRNKGKLPEPRPPFFEPWARGDESRHEGGSGLGLPIVHQIMELHKGDVTIDEDGGYVIVELKFKAV